jgi:DNA-binding CsgD family transcriptional regulator
MTNDISISDRELEILRLVATGASNQQIAQQLSISINTVKVHLRNIFSKIGVVSRTEATVYAISNGLVSVDPRVVPPVGAQRVADELDRAEALAEVLDDQAELLVADAEAPAAVILDAPPAPHLSRSRNQKVLLSVGAGVVLLAIVALGLQLAGKLAPSAPAQAPTVAALAPAASESAQRWFTHTPMPNPRAGFALATYDQERKLYVIGGRVGSAPSASIDRFDPESNLWVSLTDKPSAVSDAGAISLHGNIYVPGGIDAAGKVRDILEIFDPREQRWSLGAPMPLPRSRYALVAWEGRLYVIGGWDGARARSEVYIYDPQTNSWAEGPPLVTPRQSAGAAVNAGRIYVIGGSADSGPLREGLRLDPTAKNARWEAIAPLPVSSSAPSVVAPVGTLLVFDPTQRQGFKYDQESDSWKGFDIPADAMISSNVTLLGPSIYFVADNTSPIPGLVDEYRVIFTVFVPSSGGSSPTP